MAKPSDFSRPPRRAFLLGAGAAIAGATTLRAQPTPAPALPDPLRAPDQITVFGEGRAESFSLVRSGSRWQANDVELSTDIRKAGSEVAVYVTAPKTRLTRIRLRLPYDYLLIAVIALHLSRRLEMWLSTDRS